MLEHNRMYAMDCRDGLAMIDTATVDVVVTSPPYNIGTDYHVYDDRLPPEEYLARLKEVAAACRRVMREDASLFLVVGGTAKHPWIPLEVACTLREIFILQNTIHWIKAITIPCAYLQECPGTGEEIRIGQGKTSAGALHHADNHEFIFHFTKHGDVSLGKFPDEQVHGAFAPGGAYIPTRSDPGNVWFFPDAQPEETRHPAVFPVHLARACILDHGVGSGGLVLDPFAGIGSTALACLELGVDFIGFEIDPAYVAEADRRILAWRRGERRSQGY
jgi:site-specific DNA-methyltransferase (adenine-specific)